MDYRKIFSCLKCDAEMEIEDVRYQERVACHNCGRAYLIKYSELDEAITLTPVEPVEIGTDKARKEEPFRVLDEVGRPKREDRSEEHREQTDIHEDEDIAVNKPEQEN